MTKEDTVKRTLFESERRFRLLVEGVVDYAIYMLDPSGIITNWNPGARRIKGYEADEVVGRYFGMFYPPEEREKPAFPASFFESPWRRENSKPKAGASARTVQSSWPRSSSMPSLKKAS